ncbi:hypothetical protein [Nocardioides marmoribigeumensis]|uniref:DUF2631 domain-containing protein n=1 Tax=Nocardioides marmoribigeumensis TaxID=433649 RepID=A0ABU2BZS6_9ACTN|nr:hypothetical protein [Nocardioides marmoribigeumensis]MDR7363908.1 hypothetical protein [Nocardioides marmoribigeumensis]
MPEHEETTPLEAEDTTVLGQWQSHEVEPDDERHPGFHPLQTGYLVVGLLAVGVALLWLLTDQGVMQVGDGGVAFSIVLVIAGAVGLVASLGRALRRN